MVKQKKVPLRKCVATNEMKPKQEMIRVVMNKDGEIFVDETGKKNGRGAYVSCDIDVIEKAEKNDALNRQFKTNVDPVIYEQLHKIASGKEK